MTASKYPRAVLFACNLNRVRSPLAAALMRSFHGDAARIESCGLARGPAAGEGDGFLTAVLAEAGLAGADLPGRSFDDLAGESFDVVVSLTREAHERAIEAFGPKGSALEFWPTDDPTEASGSRELILAAYRQVRQALAARIRERFG
ncbi:MAG: low molecular weight phosphatase family protein [Caulobacteraceae bacterium]